MSEHNILDWPIWEDCPFKALVPSEIEIRLGPDILVLWWPQYEIHCDLDLRGVDIRYPLKFLTPMIGNLAGVVFEKEYPGEFEKIISARTEQAFTGAPIPAALSEANKRELELTAMIPRSSSPQPSLRA